MKSKKYVILGVGIIAVIGLAVGAYYVSQNSVSNEKLVTPEEAKSIMLDKVPGAKVLELSYDGDEKTPKYDGTLIKDKYEYEDCFTFVYIPSTSFCDIAVSDFWKNTKDEIKESLIENLKDNNCFDK